MARLSGMPSEHHHEGPGDAPRRKRGRPNKNQTASQQSQPQSQEVASSTGKRTASPSAELSQTKRSKRVQVDDEDQIAEEMEQSFSRSQNGGDTIRVSTQSTSTTTRRNGRRHSEPPVAAQDDEADELVMSQPASTQPSSGLTPHLNRVGAVRRDLATTRRARMSMPAQLHIERIDEEVDGNRIQYAPLSAILDGRTRRRLRRSHLSQEVNEFQNHQKQDKRELLQLRSQLKAQDKKITDLEFRLEAGRLGNITISAEHEQELELELEQARDQIHALRASSLYNGSERDMSTFDGAADMDDDEDDDQLMLVEPEDLKFTRTIDVDYTPDTKYTTRVHELSSQMTFESLPSVSQLTHDTLIEGDTALPDKIHDQAVERYERELRHYVELLARSQGALRVVTLELQNLHFLEAGASSDDIIVELRHAFDTLRVAIEKFFPGTTADLTNQELLHKVPDLFSGLFFELKQKLTLISSSHKTEVLLRRQYEGVLDLLGESEERVKELEANTYNLDRSNEDKQRTINELEERVTTLTTSTNDQEVEINNQTVLISDLQNDVVEKDTDLGRLREALETYRKDLNTVTLTATTFETEHHALIARMEQDHNDAIRALQLDLENEQEARDAAEGDAQQKGEIIDDLEGRIERLETEIIAFTEDMTQLRLLLAEQTEGREAAEGQRDEQAEMANEYANQIDDLQVTITDLESQLREFTTNLAAEREQREQTEAALDKANEDIEGLNQRVHDMGIQANTLRSKMYEHQEINKATIAQLEEESQERVDNLNDQLATETELRETAEKTVAKSNKQIAQLQADLETVTINLINMTEARQQLEKDREEQVVNLNQQLTDLEAKYRALETSTNSTITSLQANITDLNNQVHLQQAEIKRLAEESAAKDLLYDQDTTDLKVEIVELKEDLAGERAANEENRKEIASLSQRVDQEAIELLNMTGSHSAEVSSLTTVISTHEATIKTIQDHAAQRAEEYEEMLAERTREIEEMEMIGTARVETITMMQSQIEDLKERFAKQEEDTRLTVDALNLAHRRLMDENETLSAALKQRNAKTLKAVQEMKTAHVVVKSRNVDLSKVQTGKITKTTEKVKVGKKGRKVATRSWRDSGMFDQSSPGDQEDQEIPEDFLAA
ncbi:hypothetical protein CC86DRAFT_328285 [Ophiobolus disseminans]|uniref:Uncharacterized protein n=1 Tax=Ophiobolus disseminans TaxID=1469910 RepID=A0A6A6ZQY8_9PLEO|nr:hypothetical protein CC86DRAFT_328285 [Ophiobolus disseminans]